MKKLLVLFVAMAFVLAGSGVVFAENVDQSTLFGSNTVQNCRGNANCINGDLIEGDEEINIDFSKTYNHDDSVTIKNNKVGINDNVVKNNKVGINDNNVEIKDNLNDNQVGLVNQRGDGNISVIGGQRGYEGEGGGGAALAIVTVEDEKDPIDYGHVPFSPGKTDANMADHDGTSTIRTMSSFFKYDDDEFITMSEAKNASKGASIKVAKAIKWTPKLDGKEITLDKVNYVTVSGKHMGSLTLTTEGATRDQMEAQACEEAMLLGATSIKITEKDAKKISGSKYGFDLGSSASVALNPDTGSAIMAPGATLGWSKAKSDNRMITEVYVELFFDANLIVAE